MNITTFFFSLMALQVFAENDCAFEVLGLERAPAIQAIIDNLTDPTVRRMIAVDYANNHGLTRLIENEDTLREYLERRFRDGNAMPGYYPGTTEQQHGGILVALAHVHGIQIDLYLRNRRMLRYHPENVHRTVVIDHVALDPQHPLQLNHFQTRRSRLNTLPIEPIWKILDYLGNYRDGQNLISAIPSLAPFLGLFVKPVGARTFCELQSGQFSSWRTQRGYTALMTSIERRDIASAASILKTQKLPINSPVSWGGDFSTPLQLAISRYSSELIKLLLVFGARIEGALDWALSRFSIQHHRDILPLLGLTSRMDRLFDAARTGDIGYLRNQRIILLEAQHQNIEALLVAIKNGQIEVIEWLLDSGISLSRGSILPLPTLDM